MEEELNGFACQKLCLILGILKLEDALE